MPIKDINKRRTYHRLYQKEYYSSHEEYRAYLASRAKEWAKNNPEKRKDIARRSYHKNRARKLSSR